MKNLTLILFCVMIFQGCTAIAKGVSYMESICESCDARK